MIERLYVEFVQKAIPPETPITYNGTCVGHTVGDNFTGKPIKVVLYPYAYDVMRLCETAEVFSLEIRKYDDDRRDSLYRV